LQGKQHEWIDIPATYSGITVAKKVAASNSAQKFVSTTQTIGMKLSRESKMLGWSMIARVALSIVGLATAHLARANESASPRVAMQLDDDRHGPVPTDRIKSITVIGKREADSDRVRKLATEITVDLDWNLPIPTFTDPVCFLVKGLPQGFIGEIKDRMERNAREAGISIQKGRCRPNVFVIFVESSQKEVANLRKKNAVLYFGMRLDQMRAVESQTGPSRAWSSVEIRSRDGDRLHVNLDTGIREMKVPTASQISPALRRDIVSSIVLLDKSAMVDLNVNQIADYASLRTLAMTLTPADTKAETILNLFSGSNVLSEMSDFDRGYLNGLYSGNSNDRWPNKLGRIVMNVTRKKD
jgi:hypothetical protein